MPYIHISKVFPLVVLLKHCPGSLEETTQQKRDKVPNMSSETQRPLINCHQHIDYLHIAGLIVITSAKALLI